MEAIFQTYFLKLLINKVVPIMTNKLTLIINRMSINCNLVLNANKYKIKENPIIAANKQYYLNNLITLSNLVFL